MNTEIWQNWIFCWSPLILAHYFISCHFSPIFLTKGRLWRAPFTANPPTQAVLSSLLCCVTHHLRFFSLSLPTALHSVWVQMKRRCQLGHWGLALLCACTSHFSSLSPQVFCFCPGPGDAQRQYQTARDRAVNASGGVSSCRVHGCLSSAHQCSLPCLQHAALSLHLLSRWR